MFRITITDDDQYSPLNGVVTVASVAEALAAMPDAEWDSWNGEDEPVESVLENLVYGKERFFGFQVTYTVERMK
jgi:hypothetical protein